MGGCLSTPLPEPLLADSAGELHSNNPAQNGKPAGGAAPPPEARHKPATLPAPASFTLGRMGSVTLASRMASMTRARLHMELLSNVHELQQQLALVNDNPLLGLQEAAELLAAQLGAELAAVWVVPKQALGCSVLMAACGEGTDVLQHHIVTRFDRGVDQKADLEADREGDVPEKGSGRAAPRLGAPCKLSIPDASEDSCGAIPEELLVGPSALRSFVQVPIGDASAPLGALLLAASEPGAFNSSRWQVRLHIASTGLLPHVRHAQVDQMAHLLKSMDETQDPVALISVLLRSGARYMQRACSIRPSVRLALTRPSGGGGGPGHALLFEAARPPAGTDLLGSSAGGGGGPGGARPDAGEEVLASHMALSNTLMASAISQQQARFISDCGRYVQTCLRPARDVFTRSSELVSSIVVVPLIAGVDEPLGAVYFAVDTPCEFTNIQGTLLGFVHGVTPMLHVKLGGRIAELASMVSDSKQLAKGRTSKGSPNNTDQGRVVASGCSSSSSGPPELVKSRLVSSNSTGRVNTDAMLQVLQQEIRTKAAGRRGSGGSAAPELSLGECLGRGGFGVVYRGWWHKVPVAAKVMPSRHNEREAMQDAVEMAVLSSVQHPNIVSVYSCLTDMVEAGGNIACGSTCSSSSTRTHYRKLSPDEDPDGEAPTFNIVVTELCDRGTLRDAIKSGLLHRQLPGGAIGVDLGAAVEVLLDVAYAVQYLHSMQLVHGDIKLENILLKSDHTRPMGVTPKLSDFGLSKILNSEHGAVNVEGAGTVTHLAPEMFVAGSRVTTAVDSYAFGILMWEAYTSKRAYAGLPREAIVDRVFRAGLRPRFPSVAPQEYSSLAEACWHSEPSKRPTFPAIAERLEAMAAAIQAATDVAI